MFTGPFLTDGAKDEISALGLKAVANLVGTGPEVIDDQLWVVFGAASFVHPSVNEDHVDEWL